MSSSPPKVEVIVLLVLLSFWGVPFPLSASILPLRKGSGETPGRRESEHVHD
jgi:hypothetical protein